MKKIWFLNIFKLAVFLSIIFLGLFILSSFANAQFTYPGFPNTMITPYVIPGIGGGVGINSPFPLNNPLTGLPNYNNPIFYGSGLFMYNFDNAQFKYPGSPNTMITPYVIPGIWSGVGTNSSFPFNNSLTGSHSSLPTFGYQQQSYYPYGYQETFNPYNYQLAYPFSSLSYKDLWNTDFAGFIGSINPIMAMTILGPLGLGLDPYTKDLLMPGVWGGP